MTKQSFKKFAQHIVFLYGDYCDALVEQEQKGGTKYNDEDFNNLRGFINFLKDNWL